MTSIPPTINPLVLLGAAAALVVIVTLGGLRKDAHSPRHWIVSMLLVLAMFFLWQDLSFIVWGYVFTYTPWPVEEKFRVINVCNGTIFLGLALLLAFIEYRRTRNHESVSEE